ncbi:hypothetical protein [Amphritea sp.]
MTQEDNRSVNNEIWRPIWRNSQSGVPILVATTVNDKQREVEPDKGYPN